ncbi:hypothetical protein Q9292_09855 [Methylophilus sp. VKM B-3414]|uniref:hypothetical protein n=1 Tax=Methylophilus sp. VKM B-3414 TaxID=3076121 RepID=UPI0028C56A11|nr:hypothetical protein [Methylophilus sp. VKM B-3414]MDT7849915.1 hypothetical protein [Methylophilus sp. VKM B-3414]
MNPIYEVIISGKDQTKQAFDSIIGNVGKVNGLVAGLGISISAGGLAALIKQAADFNDEMGDMAQTLGTTTENLSALQYAAKFGGGVDELNAGLTKLAKNASDAANGSKSAQQAFDQLGIDPAKFNDTSELFEAIVEQLSLLPDGIQKTAIAQDLLGKSGAKLLPLINGGKEGLRAMREEAERLGLVVSEQDAVAAGEFNDNLDRLSLTAKGLAVQFGNQFVPIMNEVGDRMVEAAKKGGILSGVIEGILATGEIVLFGDEFERRLSKIDELNKDLQTYSTRLDLINKGDSILEAIYGKDETRAKIEETSKELKKLLKEQSDFLNKKIPSSPAKTYELPPTPTGKTEAEKQAEAAARAADSFVQSLKKQADQLGLTKSEQIAYEASLLKLTDAQRKSVSASTAKIEAYEREKETLKDLADFEKMLRESDNQQLEVDTSISAAQDQQVADQVAAADKLNQQLIEKNEQLNIDLIENDKERAKAQLELENKRIVESIEALVTEQEVRDDLLAKQASAYEKQMQKIEQSSKNTTTIGKELGLVFKSSFEDAIVGTGDFGDALEGLGQDIERLAARRLVLEPLLQAFDQLLSGAGGSDILGSIFSTSPVITNAKGGVYSGAGISAYSGQVVSSPTLFPFAKGVGLMGEAGPEAIVPLKRGANGALGVSAEGMGGGKVTVNIINPPSQANVSQSQDAQGNLTLDVMFDRIKNELSRDVRRNGPFATALQDQYSLSRVGGAA